MTDQQINNKLIAEFDGWREHDTLKGVYVKDEMTLSSNPYAKSLFSYHTDWNLLMPVVVKIQNIKTINTNGYEVWRFKLHAALCEADIKTLYKAVVEFIEWYNQQGE